MLGLVPTTEPTAPDVAGRGETGVELIDRLGFARAVLRERCRYRPACGLAGAGSDWARAALALVNDVTRAFAEDPESLGSAADRPPER